MTSSCARTLRVAASCSALLLFLGACTSERDEPELPPAEEAAQEFVDAWNERDTGGMAALLTRPVPRFRRLFRDVLHGRPIDFEVALGDVETTPGADDDGGGGAPPSATAAYAITYSVGDESAAEPLEGELALAYDAGEWAVEWVPSAMWPGYERATGIELSYRWPPRAPILDRSGRVLARGRASNRRYPFGAAAGSTVGHIGVVSRKESAESGRYEPGDLAGASGIEAAFDERLAGRPGVQLDVTRGSRTQKRVIRAPPDPGRPLKTTLDMRVQGAAAAAYGGTIGGAVVLDPATGDLLAVVSSAELNPESYVGARDVQPFNRALSGLYPPGSALKVMTGAAALETGVVDPGTGLTGPAEYKGVRNFESGEFGTLDFATAVKFSVNTAFAQIAEDLGAKRLTRYARAFGFNRPPRMALG
ncbi:MAG: penicillin-binding transpeptidase domain-containing protein, partial [Actinomycetota bacterium]|nr:penicillin-binding transpeptidase domain-containing protein [Actinomycetota bacterium]